VLESRPHPSALVTAACAERSPRVVPGTPSALTVSTGFGELVPAAVAALPLVHHDRVIGAVELALPVGEPQIRSLLGELLPTVAAVLAHRLDEDRIHRLLEQTSEQAEVLRELNAALDERASLLAEQQRDLEESHTELQMQAQELSDQRSALLATNEQLEEAHQLAEQRAQELDTASRYKSQFLANMSHELRTPLNSILILARLLADDDGERLDPDQLESARAIGSAGRDLLALINDILDISRIEVGELRISPVRFDVGKSLQGLDRLFRPVAEERGLTFEIASDPDLPRRIVADELRLQQILRNLLSNALKFTDHGSVRLRVHAPDTSGQLRFTVEDTGTGIPPGAQQSIFRAFKQADGSLTRKHNGAGLGLAISKQLAERMGGSLVLDRSSPSGSMFTLELPVALPDPTPAPPPRRPAPSHRSLVIVEDDPILGQALENLAQTQGCSARWFATGEAAWEHCERNPPDCVLVDLCLPGIGGRELAAKLARNPRTRDVPVHAMSGVVSEGRAPGPGIASFLAKPIQADRFVDWLGTSLRGLRGEVLVIGGDPTEAAAMSKLLRRNGIACSHSTDVEEGARRCAEGTVRCVVLGLELGSDRGLDFLARRRDDPRLAAIPVIVSTARELSEEEQTVLEQEARSILVKREPLSDRLVQEATRIVGSTPLAPPRRAAPRWVGRRVLVVDDDMRNVFALRQLLRRNGMAVVVANDGAEALRRVDEHGPFDAILLDVMMPVMDGLEATRRLRARPDGAGMYLCALTAKVMPGDRERCLEAGASDYLGKPIDNEVLLQLLSERFAATEPVAPPVGGGP